MTQPLFDVPAPQPTKAPVRPGRRRRRWTKCDDCGRRVWAYDSLRVCPDGKRRGDKCRRKAARKWRLWRPPRRRSGIPQMRPGKDQLVIDITTDQET